MRKAKENARDSQIDPSSIHSLILNSNNNLRTLRTAIDE